MYFLPFFIKHYSTSITKRCFLHELRSKTLYKYDSNGYIKSTNPDKLICRNEVNGIIYLRDELIYGRSGGGVTVIFLKNDKNKDQLSIRTIAFHDFIGSLWFLMLAVIGVYSFLTGKEGFWAVFVPVTIFSFFFGLMHNSQFKRQRKLIEKVIETCENS